MMSEKLVFHPKKRLKTSATPADVSQFVGKLKRDRKKYLKYNTPSSSLLSADVPSFLL